MIKEGGVFLGEYTIVAVLLVVAAICIVAVVPNVLEATIFSEHALTSHTRDIPDINKCFDGDGSVSSEYTNDHGRWAEFCEDDGKHVYWRIFACSGEDKIIVTQFKMAANRVANFILNKDMLLGEASC